jgi:hypothetical protein
VAIIRIVKLTLANNRRPTSSGGNAMGRKTMSAAVALAGLFWATGALACQTCITVTITKDGVPTSTETCYPSPCPHGAGVVFKMPFSPSLRVREGSVCTVKLKTNSTTKSTQGIVHGHTCVLNSR